MIGLVATGDGGTGKGFTPKSSRARNNLPEGASAGEIGADKAGTRGHGACKSNPKNPQMSLPLPPPPSASAATDSCAGRLLQEQEKRYTPSVHL